jgi:hypothetical protein
LVNVLFIEKELICLQNIQNHHQNGNDKQEQRQKRQSRFIKLLELFKQHRKDKHFDSKNARQNKRRQKSRHYVFFQAILICKKQFKVFYDKINHILSAVGINK